MVPVPKLGDVCKLRKKLRIENDMWAIILRYGIHTHMDMLRDTEWGDYRTTWTALSSAVFDRALQLYRTRTAQFAVCRTHPHDFMHLLSVRLYRLRLDWYHEQKNSAVLNAEHGEVDSTLMTSPRSQETTFTRRAQMPAGESDLGSDLDVDATHESPGDASNNALLEATYEYSFASVQAWPNMNGQTELAADTDRGIVNASTASTRYVGPFDEDIPGLIQAGRRKRAVSTSDEAFNKQPRQSHRPYAIPQKPDQPPELIAQAPAGQGNERQAADRGVALLGEFAPYSGTSLCDVDTVARSNDLAQSRRPQRLSHTHESRPNFSRPSSLAECDYNVISEAPAESEGDPRPIEASTSTGAASRQTKEDLMHSMIESVFAVRKTLEEELGHKSQALANKTAELKRLSQALDDKNAELAHMSRVLDNKVAELEDKSHILDNVNAELASVRKILKDVQEVSRQEVTDLTSTLNQRSGELAEEKERHEIERNALLTELSNAQMRLGQEQIEEAKFKKIFLMVKEVISLGES